MARKTWKERKRGGQLGRKKRKKGRQNLKGEYTVEGGEAK